MQQQWRLETQKLNLELKMFRAERTNLEYTVNVATLSTARTQKSELRPLSGVEQCKPRARKNPRLENDAVVVASWYHWNWLERKNTLFILFA